MKIPYNILIQIKMSVRPYFKGFTLIFFFYNCRKQDYNRFYSKNQPFPRKWGRFSKMPETSAFLNIFTKKEPALSYMKCVIFSFASFLIPFIEIPERFPVQTPDPISHKQT